MPPLYSVDVSFTAGPAGTSSAGSHVLTQTILHNSARNGAHDVMHDGSAQRKKVHTDNTLFNKILANSGAIGVLWQFITVNGSIPELVTMSSRWIVQFQRMVGTLVTM